MAKTIKRVEVILEQEEGADVATRTFIIDGMTKYEAIGMMQVALADLITFLNAPLVSESEVKPDEPE